MDGNPFHKLPQETLTMIALEARSVDIFHEGLETIRWRIPLQAMLVCARWYDAIRREPHFWRQIRITSSTPPQSITTAIDRSGALSLEVWVNSNGVANEAALAVVGPHRHRWEVLVLGDDEDHHPSAVQNDRVRQWLIQELPQLKRLHIAGAALGPREGGRPDNLTLPNLEILSFWSTIPRYHVPNSPLLRRINLNSCMISLKKLLRYLSDAAESLTNFSATDTLVTDIDTQGRVWSTIDMARLEVVEILADGYDGLAQDVLKHVHCPSLRMFIFRAPNDHQTTWIPIELHLPNLETIDFRGHILPPAALRNILFAAPSLRRLVFPTIPDEARSEELLEIMMAYAVAGERVLADVVDNGFSPSQLHKLVEAMPSIKRMDLTDGGFTSWEGCEDGEERMEMKWLQENVEEMVGLKQGGSSQVTSA